MITMFFAGVVCGLFVAVVLTEMLFSYEGDSDRIGQSVDAITEEEAMPKHKEFPRGN